MAERRRFFRCIGGLCMRQKNVSQVTEPTLVPVPNEVPPGTVFDETEPMSPKVPMLPLDAHPLALNAMMSSSRCASTAREPTEQMVVDATPLVTADLYDPLIMSFSPRITRRSIEVYGQTKQPVATDPPTMTISTPKVGDTIDTNHFWYGVTLFNGDKKKTSFVDDLDAAASTSTVDEPQSTAASFGRSDSHVYQSESSMRYYELMSYRISDDWSSLNSRVYDALLQYFMGSELPSNRSVCQEWAQNVRILMSRKTAKIVNAFKAAYEGQLDLETSYMICQSVFTAQKSMRIDLILRAKVLPWSVNSRNTLQYTYNYMARNIVPGHPTCEPTYASKFVFECLKRNSRRTVSFTRDVSSIHGDDLHVAAPESVSQICEGDSIEVPVVLMNALGNTDIDSIKFLPLRRQPPSGDLSSSLDKMHREWYTVGPNSKYLQQLFPSDIDEYSLVQPEKLKPELSHQITQVAGIDVITSRSNYMAAKPGKVIKAQNFIGHTLEVVEPMQPIVCMLHRAGMQYDRLCHVQLRVVGRV
ncbi:hypothetical protein BaOVIS_014270 [Babesia ovis]|uniref:Uncharacterized protein n=1 Tax=Babesia ovis TaxID=5869 RepID=A0A9W5TA20_BABOV|nr:hypothetical protein BaOVIS_014270 [Babesia ovis]